MNLTSQNVMVFQLHKTVLFIAIIHSFYVFIQHLNLHRYGKQETHSLSTKKAHTEFHVEYIMHEYIIERRKYVKFNTIRKHPEISTGPKYNEQVDCFLSLTKYVTMLNGE